MVDVWHTCGISVEENKVRMYFNSRHQSETQLVSRAVRPFTTHVTDSIHPWTARSRTLSVLVAPLR